MTTPSVGLPSAAPAAVGRPDPYAPAPYPTSAGAPFRFGQPAGVPAVNPPAGAPLLGPALGPPPGAPVASQPPGNAPPVGYSQAAPPGVAPPSVTAPPISAPPVPSPTAELFEPGQIVATVGNQFVLAGDVMAQVNQILEPMLAKIPKDLPPAEQEAIQRQLAEARDKYSRVTVQQMIDTKLLYLEFERYVAKNVPADKQDEMRKNMNRKITENFDAQLAETRKKVAAAKGKQDELMEIVRKDQILARLAMLMQERQIETMADLDLALRGYGSSLERQKRAFAENLLGRQQVFNSVKTKKEVSHLDMLYYYRDHASEFAKEARAKFEIISVRLDRFPSKEAAWQALAAMGNEIFFGASFAAVAKRGSHDPNAEQGGQYGWTTRGSLASEVIDKAIFTFEPGKLSPILEDERGFHIVRVLEREEAGAVPFFDAQTKIKEAILQERRNVAFKEFLDGLRTKTTIWSIYDPPATAQNPASATQPR